MSSYAQDLQGKTALMYAASRDLMGSDDHRNEIVDKLLYHGADILARDNEVKLPLACSGRYVQLMNCSNVVQCVCYVSHQQLAWLRLLAYSFCQPSNCFLAEHTKVGLAVLHCQCPVQLKHAASLV